MQRTKSKILSILLSLVMLLSLLPTTALAADYPYPDSVFVDGGKSFSTSQLYYKNNDVAGSFSGSDTSYNAHYDPDNGILTLNGYEGGQIKLGGEIQRDLTIKLIGDNKITVNGDVGIVVNSYECNITITAESGSSGTLTINVEIEASVYDGVTGIGNYLATGGGTSGNVTITGHADVTINATSNTANYTSYGIYAGKVIIEENAKAAITVNAPKNTGGGFVYGIYAKDNVTIDTAGEITVDVSNAGTGNVVYSTGVRSMNTLTLTKVGKMTVKWNDNLGNSGFPLYPTTASFDSNAYDTNVDETTCTATYMPKGTAITGELAVAITAPVKGEVPQSSITETEQYTGAITWEGNPTTFVANTEYTANVTLTAKDGYQFADGVIPTVAGADHVTGGNISNGGKTLTFDAKFPKTDTRTLKGIDIITKPELKLAVPTAAPNGTATNERSLAVTGVYDDGTGGPVTVNWEITTDPIPKGVSLVGSTLKVTNEAEKTCTFTIRATYDDGSANYTDIEQVTITKEPLKETHIVATAPAGGTNITIPNGGTNTSGQCSYKVYDQYGAEMAGTTATWKMDPETVTGVTFTASNGSISVNNTATNGTVKLYAESGGVKSNEITFNIARETSVAKSLTIEGSINSVNVPTVTEPGTTECAYAAYNATVKDQYGAEMPGQTIAWSVTDNPGVTINNGQLTVTNKATAGNVTITAKSGTLTATKTVTINKDTAKETFVKITAQGGATPVTTIICTGSQRLEYYTATVYDQYGNEKQDDVTWSLDPTPSGVTYEVSTTSDNIVTLKVAPDTAAGTFKLVATSKTVTTVKGELPITVQKKTDVSGKINFNDGSLTYNGEGQEYKTAALDSSVTAGDGGTWTYTYTAGTGTLDTATGLPKTVGTYTVTATYEDSSNIGSKSATLTITPKTVDIPAEDKTVYIYDGTEKTYNIPTSTDYTVSGNKQTNAKEAGYIVTVKLNDEINTIWADNTPGQKIFMFKIMRATPTGEPTYTKITTSGKTLKDANLTKDTIAPAGTIKWVAEDGTDLAKDTAVEANKLYKWVFTPSDTANYKPLTGTIKLWSKSTSSGGYYYAPTVPDMPMLYRGCTGDAVKTLQDKLNALGYNSGSVDGIFGAKTYAAVTAFQKANSLGVDGIVGKLTWGKIYGVSPAMPVETTTVVGRPMVSYGSRGDAVRKLQELLNALGYDCGSVDGIFGSKTKAAVLAFQKANGLGVDGIVGPLTWAKLG